MPGLALSNIGLLGSLTADGLFFVARATGTTSVTIPANAQAGDLAILYTAAHGTAIAKVFPADFQEVREDHDVDDARMVSGYKILVAGDPGSTKIGMNDTEENIGVMIFRLLNKPITSVTTFSINGQATTGDPSAQTIAMSTLQTPLIGVSFMSGTTQVQPSYSPNVMTSFTGYGSTTGESAMAYVIYNEQDTPEDIVVDMLDEGDNAMQSWAIVVS